MSLQPLVSLYQYALIPLAPFSWFGLQISSLDLLAAFRLCYVLRHLRENLKDDHAKRRATDSKLPAPEDRSFVRDALTVLTVVYGGEAIAGTPSISPIASHHPTRPSSSSPRCPRLVYDLGRRPSAVHRRTNARGHPPLFAAHGAQLGAAIVLFRRPHPRHAHMYPRTPRRTP